MWPIILKTLPGNLKAEQLGRGLQSRKREHLHILDYERHSHRLDDRLPGGVPGGVARRQHISSRVVPRSLGSRADSVGDRRRQVKLAAIALFLRSARAIRMQITC